MKHLALEPHLSDRRVDAIDFGAARWAELSPVGDDQAHGLLLALLLVVLLPVGIEDELDLQIEERVLPLLGDEQGQHEVNVLHTAHSVTGSVEPHFLLEGFQANQHPSVSRVLIARAELVGSTVEAPVEGGTNNSHGFVTQHDLHELSNVIGLELCFDGDVEDEEVGILSEPIRVLDRLCRRIERGRPSVAFGNLDQLESVITNGLEPATSRPLVLRVISDHDDMAETGIETVSNTLGHMRVLVAANNRNRE